MSSPLVVKNLRASLVEGAGARVSAAWFMDDLDESAATVESPCFEAFGQRWAMRLERCEDGDGEPRHRVQLRALEPVRLLVPVRFRLSTTWRDEPLEDSPRVSVTFSAPLTTSTPPHEFLVRRLTRDPELAAQAVLENPFPEVKPGPEFLSALAAAYDDPRVSDCRVRIGDSVPVHASKAVLSVHSTFFAGMFSGPYVENSVPPRATGAADAGGEQPTPVVIKEVDPVLGMKCLKWTYTGSFDFSDVQGFTDDTVMRAYRVADRLMMPGLLVLLRRALEERPVTCRNFAALYTYAREIGSPALEDSVFEFWAKEFAEARTSPAARLLFEQMDPQETADFFARYTSYLVSRGYFGWPRKRRRLGFNNELQD